MAVDKLDLIIPSLSNIRSQFSGIDQESACLDPEHFLTYPYNVDYIYNERGFRDLPWPRSDSGLRKAVWCIGDSFTVGLGAPWLHTWPSRLSAVKQVRTINISMDGASNEWIVRTAQKIAKLISPANIIVMWSFTHRREHPDSSLPDSSRKQHYVKSTAEQDWDNFLKCSQSLKEINSNIVEFAVPNFHKHEFILKMWNSIRGEDWPIWPPDTLDDLHNLPPSILTEMDTIHGCLNKFNDIFKFQQQLLNDYNVIEVNQKDYARDGFHFDLITADWIVNRISNRLV